MSKRKKLKIRDYLLLALILGATKASVTVDQKKKRSKRLCRKKINPNTKEEP